MKRKSLSSRLTKLATAGVLAGSLLGASPAAKGQGVVNSPQVVPTTGTIGWSGTVNELFGTGNGVTLGESANGSVPFNANNLLLIAGNGSTSGTSFYRDTTDSLTTTVGGITTTTTGFEFGISYESIDYNNTPADILSVSWGYNFSANAIDLYYPLSAASDTSLTSVEQLLESGLAGALTYNDDATFNVGYDNSGMNGGQGNLSTFGIVSTPEPSAWALGGLGGVALAASRLRRNFKRHGAQKVVALPSGM